MNRDILALLLLFCTTILYAQSQTVSGKITGPDGERISGASIREIDNNRRIYNTTKSDKNGIYTFSVRDNNHSIQVLAKGFRKITHKMLGKSTVNVHLERPRFSSLFGKEKVILKTKDLLCGHVKSKNVPVLTFIEQVNDTTYSLVLPVRVETEIDEYPAGRTLLVLAEGDRQLMRWENAVDVYPQTGDPSDAKEMVLALKYNGLGNLLGVSSAEEDLHVYPHFLFTRSDLHYLTSNPNALRRIVVDTHRADNYWNFYPTEKTIEILKDIERRRF